MRTTVVCYSLIVNCIFLSSGLLPSQSDFPERNPPDYKIIVSNSSYIEIEYYPRLELSTFMYNNELLTNVTAENCESGTEKTGEPDLKYRTFPVILPSERNNSVSVIDAEFSDVKNVNLAPVPTYTYKDPHKTGFENLEISYIRNPDRY